MKKLFAFAGFCIFLFSCSKEKSSAKTDVTVKAPSFIQYTIRKGQNYCDGNGFTPVQYSELKFVAKFDSSAIYKNVDPNNQYDINKLYGFSDNNQDHHQFSARFGWRWSDNALRLFGYIYNNGVMKFKELGIIEIGAENNCSIKVTAASYIFTLNGKVDSLPRLSTTPLGSGYKLYPYFGGDEVAPHDVFVWIREL